ncbi:MAG: GNAT family N-acetyltransferase [Candidatus Aegiribacteria sp.]|nr:GNAT family N-acetyltransferase [Candidatus Aegiribacteria sp.]MBD3294581.1 GNAT family N-acetyltransferase [Candidatus Fermentibacteria bacterium]
MKPVSLHNKDLIEGILRRNLYLNIYGLGDLDDFYWPYTVWYSQEDCSEEQPVALLYLGLIPPTLLALSHDGESMRDLAGSLVPLLPRRFHAHLSPGVERAFRKDFTVHSAGDFLKMALEDPAAVAGRDTSGTRVLGSDDREVLVEFYSRCYPGNYFDPRMLKTEKYFGIFLDGELVSAAGVHVYSKKYGVAALGNIATAPSHRGRGLGTRVTARACQSLLKDIKHVGLNVKADNRAAVVCYRKLGFEPVADYGEFMFERK